MLLNFPSLCMLLCRSLVLADFLALAGFDLFVLGLSECFSLPVTSNHFS